MAVHRLILDRPLVSFDLETTGLDVKRDRVVEICCVKLLQNGDRRNFTTRLNPEYPISQEAARVHGIQDQDVQDKPTFRQIARELLTFFENSDLTGFNIESFDLPLLQAEFSRSNMTFPEHPVRIVDSRKLFVLKEPRDLRAAYRFYCGKELTGAHSAEADAEAAADILFAQVDRYSDLPSVVCDLHDVSHPMHPDWLDPDGKLVRKQGGIVFTFGKYKNERLDVVVKNDTPYLRWVISADFSATVRKIINDALDGKFPEASITDAAA